MQFELLSAKLEPLLKRIDWMINGAYLPLQASTRSNARHAATIAAKRGVLSALQQLA